MDQVVSGEPACAARREVTRSNPRPESVHRGHCRSLSLQRRFRTVRIAQKNYARWYDEGKAAIPRGRGAGG